METQFPHLHDHTSAATICWLPQNYSIKQVGVKDDLFCMFAEIKRIDIDMCKVITKVAKIVLGLVVNVIKTNIIAAHHPLKNFQRMQIAFLLVKSTRARN